MSLDDDMRQAVDLTADLRAWIRARHAHPDMVLAGALAYELCALVARNAETESTALALIDAWAGMMRDQIRAFGVEMEHP